MSPRVLMGGANSAAKAVAAVLKRERGCDVFAESNAAALLKRRESSNGFHIIILSSTLTPGAWSGDGRALGSPGTGGAVGGGIITAADNYAMADITGAASKTAACAASLDDAASVAAADGSAAAASSGTDAKSAALFSEPYHEEDNAACAACRKLRMTDASTPIIVLAHESRERGLWPYYESGADMCIGWPVSERLLLARFDSLLRRSGFEPCRDVITRGELCLDYASSTLTIDEYRKIKLPTRQLELLYCLMSNSGIVMSREQLLRNAWETDYDGSDRTLDTHIKCLRAVLGEYGRYIKTLRKIGYCFDVS